MTIAQTIKKLTRIPGVGQSIATDLYNIGVRCIDDLKGKDPQQLYDKSNQYADCVQDRCVLYVFRCAVYFAVTPANEQDSEQLKWWN
ncbi:pathogenicity locus [Niastella caeni]|uniref:Pathogenicity locus n=1 Tax=Niastella caeni TaxID=2569763 RepID=A0A4S8HXB9_9BACT|nr:helix-hairpin-helix domain-containing protein [Niastella caeni]THU40363.1 pathogenicity locus [Niastella caeni]